MLREVLTVGELRLLAAREASGVAGGWRRRSRWPAAVREASGDDAREAASDAQI